MALVIHAGFWVFTYRFRDLPLWAFLPLCAVWLAWYGSLQHETIHGHPTRWRRVNRALGAAPLALWFPYAIYVATHLTHHRHAGRRLTEVNHDPESFYVAPGTLARYGAIGRLLLWVNCTLAGRLLGGPAIAVYRFWSGELYKVRAGDGRRRAIWARHGLGVILVLWWITQVCHIPLAVYLLGVVYPSISLTLLRSFAEHRADPDPARRTLSVETNPFWSLLFLNNNLHVAHHAQPSLAWHRLPGLWARLREQARTRGQVYEGGYLQVAANHLVRPVIGIEHPHQASLL